MQTNSPELGAVTSVHRPSTARLWVMSAIVLALLMPILFGIFLFITSLTRDSDKSLASISSPLLFAGVPALLLMLVAGFWIKDYRKLSKTRTVKLTVYQNGFTYESDGRKDSCRWNEIKDITHRSVQIHSKHAPPRRVRLIWSIVKKDGELISFAETLDLMKITRLIETARNDATH